MDPTAIDEADPTPARPAWCRPPAGRRQPGRSCCEGGDELFPPWRGHGRARHEVWLATYIFHDDGAGRAVADALTRRGAARRGGAVVVDGFGSDGHAGPLRAVAGRVGVELEVFRPLDRWWTLAAARPAAPAAPEAVRGRPRGGLRRRHQHHRRPQRPEPRLERPAAAGLRRGVRGPLVAAVHTTAQAMWTRARLGHGWRDEVRALAAAPRRWTTRCA
jgi:cardiolipin synthase